MAYLNNSCLGCKFLYENGTGYSNYTWMETYLLCALDRNHNLLSGEIESPYGFEDQKEDRFNPTKNSRCEKYDKGVFITLPPDRDEDLCDESEDFEQIDLIWSHDRKE